MNDQSFIATRLALGAVAGLAGTVAILGFRTATQKWLPRAMVPEREDPGKFMVEAAQSVLPQGIRRQVPETVESAAARSVHIGYGSTPGALYAALRPEAGNSLLEGAALGLGIWAVGYLGWLPAIGITPPVTEQRAEQITASLLQHALYGVVTVATYRRLRDLTFYEKTRNLAGHCRFVNSRSHSC